MKRLIFALFISLPLIWTSCIEGESGQTETTKETSDQNDKVQEQDNVDNQGTLGSSETEGTESVNNEDFTRVETSDEVANILQGGPSDFLTKDEYFEKIALQHQEFTIDPTRENIITGSKGTELIIPTACLVDEDGNLPSGTIVIRLKECYDYPDMLTERLTTTSGDERLITGGMIHLEAFAGDKKLQIREGMDISIGFPAEEPDEDMQLFYGDRDDQGKVDWELDPLSQEQAPVIVCRKGIFWDKMMPFVPNNYKVPKRQAVKLLEKETEWSMEASFDDQGKLLSKPHCTQRKTIEEQVACESFFNFIGDLKDSVPHLKFPSWETSFTFQAITQEDYRKEKAEFDQWQKQRALARRMQNVLYATNLGWINCDKFDRSLAPKIEYVIASDDPKIDYFLVFKSSRSIMSGIKKGNKVHFPAVPKGKNVVVLAFYLEENVPFVGTRDTKIKPEVFASRFKFKAVDESAPFSGLPAIN